MFNVTIKEYLLQIKEQNIKVKKQQEYIQRLKDSLDIAGISYEEEKVQSSVEPDKFAKIFSQIEEEEKILDIMKNTLIRTRVKIINQIQQLDNSKHKDILNIVYVDGKNLRKAAQEMKFSYDYIKEIHLSALQAFEEKFPLQPT